MRADTSLGGGELSWSYLSVYPRAVPYRTELSCCTVMECPCVIDILRPCVIESPNIDILVLTLHLAKEYVCVKTKSIWAPSLCGFGTRASAPRPLVRGGARPPLGIIRALPASRGGSPLSVSSRLRCFSSQSQSSHAELFSIQ